MISQILNYRFLPATKQVVLEDVFTVDISRVQYIRNITKNVELYNYSTSAPLVSDGTNIVTVPTSCAGMTFGNELYITYDFDICP